ncbi:retrovirus-related pol polyprotein from transposon TNT 1-94 [Tanacetum coccineum]|uniref:Retrovirus-related pol polyprotein from transposon TNT 1-94 n=1 Tax=Tanacetum coccineum TaxID=301880 RepID=A0ABQ5FNK4_9ASTR
MNEALGDKSWIVAMQEEINQFIANDIWELVPQPRNMTIIGTKWVFRNKLDENGIVSRNKARLVAQGYNQQEGIDYDETYAPVARHEKWISTKKTENQAKMTILKHGLEKDCAESRPRPIYQSQSQYRGISSQLGARN